MCLRIAISPGLCARNIKTCTGTPSSHAFEGIGFPENFKEFQLLRWLNDTFPSK